MYISLHNRTAYSFNLALTMPGELAAFAAREGMPAIAVTDLAGLYAAVEFQQACDKAGVRPIFGAELPLACGTSSAMANDVGGPADGAGVILLAQSLTGYGNLCRLISLHHLRDLTPLSLSELREHAADLICLFGPCLAHPTGQPHAAASARRMLTALQDIFTARLYVELVIHTHADLDTMRRRACLADELGIPVVATCDARCVHAGQFPALLALSSIGTLTMLNQPHAQKPEGNQEAFAAGGRRRAAGSSPPAGSYHLRTVAEMRRRFDWRPDALANTLRIAETCHVRLETGRNRFPPFESPDGRTAMAHLRELSVAGCRRRYVEHPPFRGIGGRRATLAESLERLERELSIIEQVHYAEYFLVFHEIVEECRRRGISTLARGSAADSLVCYVLGVSHACPFRFDLPFDRFVNPERAKFSKMADIDLDLPWDRRDEIIHWVYDRWGHDRVAMIGCPNTFHARAAVAELGKVHGLPAHEVHRVTKMLPHVTAWNLEEAISRSPEARQLLMDPGGQAGRRQPGRVADRFEEPYRTMLRLARELEGLPRHWAMHPCGLVVSPHPLAELVPVQRSPKGPLVAQYDMHAIEDLGFVKIDLLGQAGLSVLRDAVEEINRTGADVDLDRDVDYSDTATWDMIATGNARGVHHIESPAMTSLLQQCNCRDIDCLTTVVAIIRPGAANQGKKEAFARRHQGMEPPSFVHPAVRPILEQTYGLMVFEEHILQVATEFAGMNIGRADVLRRALNKEDRRLIGELGAEFRASARARGRTETETQAVWSLLEGFAGFMFNKAHSAEYAIEAFQGAWLKLRWPAHYIAAILSNYRGFYASSPTLPQILYVMEALRLGASFLPPCVNRSRRRFCMEDAHSGEPRTRIRVPVSHIHGLAQEFIDRHLSEREAGPFTSLADFFHRCRPTDTEARSLLNAGALDCFGDSRSTLFWRLRQLTGRQGRAAGLLWADDDHEMPPVQLTEPDTREIARREMDLLGFPITMDPLSYLSVDAEGRRIDWSRYVPVAELRRHLRQRVTVCGLMVADRINATTQGDLMKFVTLGDRTGFIETILFPDAYQQFGHLTIANPVLAATGIVEPFENGLGFTLRVERVQAPHGPGAAGIRAEAEGGPARTGRPAGQTSQSAGKRLSPPNPNRRQ